ncbi:MAG TPA: acyl-CoA thioesterase [Phycisphaerales bacterium]|nr:acyl-CoA thioesterase [Phycisphaerales bacterium]HIB00566.1 acyl-CoA thioesterase [Phycisphaerales bacterium]HIB51119.1 acyl-CoA thioesterase [Phycisphaerales bacterium]HIN83569.1 acyl-CoA thioesterase [Phycisphaerales bacterium]HIO20624.1 acyl-CoA thioesterase [Phycisphaerales bacterium]
MIRTMEKTTALSVIMMPRDANVLGTIFGGIILSYIDQAGFVEARRNGIHRWVTASMDKVDFEKPVYVGDVVRFITKTAKTGRTSVGIEVVVEAERFNSGNRVVVTTATLTMVSVDEHGKSIPFDSPSTFQQDEI